MPSTPITFYFSEFDEVNERFMALGSFLVRFERTRIGTGESRRMLAAMAKLLPAQFAFEHGIIEDCIYPDNKLHESAHEVLCGQLRLLLDMPPNDERRLDLERKFRALIDRHVKIDDNLLIKFLDSLEVEHEQTVTTKTYRNEERSVDRS